MLSHIALDTLNKKKIQLFYPLPAPKIGFNICYADGKVNELIFWGASAAAVIKLVTTVNSFR
jgi:inner membrane protein